MSNVKCHCTGVARNVGRGREGNLMVQEIIRERKVDLECLFQNYGVSLAYLFGSTARQTEGPLSDIDIAVLFSGEVKRDQYGKVQVSLMAELIGFFHKDDVEVAVLNTAPPLLRYEVYQGGVLIYSASEEARVDFEVKALRDYCDTARMRQTMWMYLLERVESRSHGKG